MSRENKHTFPNYSGSPCNLGAAIQRLLLAAVEAGRGLNAYGKQ